MKKIVVLDSTLRDGSQAQGISYTVEDKLKIVKRLDALGVAYIEAGNRDPIPRIWSSSREFHSLNWKTQSSLHLAALEE